MPRISDIRIEKISLSAAFIFFTALTFFSRDIPFFWDENYYIPAAHQIFDSGFTRLIPSLEFDRGNFPFYGFYMALWWTVFGKSLWVSHLAILPLLIGISLEYYKLAKTFLPGKWIPFALLLLLVEPTFITQGIYMGHDLFLVYFFLLTVNATLSGKTSLYALSLCLLALHNIKGIPFAFSLIAFYFAYNRRILRKNTTAREWMINCLPLPLWIAWAVYHHEITGWYLFTPAADYGKGLHFDLFGLKRIILGIWQVIDFGRVFLWGVLLAGLFAFRKKMQEPPVPVLPARRSFSEGGMSLLFIPLCFSLVFFAALDIDLCHRYFMPVFLIVNIAACFFLQMIQKKIRAYLIGLMLCTGLVTGNFWIYGGGFSNGWDSSLKSLPYFGLRDDMNSFVKKNRIDPASVGTRFPMHHDLKYSDLAPESFHFTEIDQTPVDSFRYVLLSNISNQFSPGEKAMLNSKWAPVYEIQKGQVYLKLLKNPN